MALANPLGLVFATISVTHAVNDIFEMQTLLYPSVDFKKRRGLKAPSIETAPAYLDKYVEEVTKAHIVVHAATVGSLIWSLVSIPSTRTIASAALIFEVSSLAVSPFLLTTMEEILAAKTPAGIEGGLKKVIWQQLARMLFLHLPCLLCCLSAVMRLTASL